MSSGYCNQKIYRQTFFETFSEQDSEENMRIFLDKAYSEEKLKSEIEDKESETFLAVENQKTLGNLEFLLFGLASGRKIFLLRNSTRTKALEDSASMLLF